jgi:hypothetical protein
MWHIVYLSFEEGASGRNYIGKHSTDNLEDGYLGSYSDSSFFPTSRIILEYSSTVEGALEAEIRWQRVFKVVEDPQFANRSYQTSTKFDTTGIQMSEEYKKNRSEKYTGEGNPNHGKTTPNHVKEKISQSLTGKTFTEERREAQSKALQGNTNNKGKKLSEESCRKRSESQKGKKRGPYKKKEKQ